jgi:hypothetical protein
MFGYRFSLRHLLLQLGIGSNPPPEGFFADTTSSRGNLACMPGIKGLKDSSNPAGSTLGWSTHKLITFIYI